MLIEFSVKNFRSFAEEQSLSLLKSAAGELSQTNTFTTETTGNISLLRSAAIYGANASGKSNLIRALQAMQHIVTTSASGKTGQKLSVTPFRLRSDMINKPSMFEVLCIADGVRYQYGFCATRDRVTDEWLFAYPKGRAQKWFERSWNNRDKEYKWSLGYNLSGEKQIWQRSTREDALFLSTAVQLNSEQLRPLFKWFEETIKFANVGGWSPTFTAQLCREEKKQILEFLHAADISITDIDVQEEPFDPRYLSDDMPEPLKELVVDQMHDKQIMDISTAHLDDSGNKVFFDFDEESDGTRKLFSFAGPWIDSLSKGYALFIDELHDNLHPKLVAYLISLFQNPAINTKNAQLIFTTHDTSILTQDIFRRDQVWFCEKGTQQASSLIPLIEFKPKKGRENLEVAYLSGRYGAVPHISSAAPAIE